MLICTFLQEYMISSILVPLREKGSIRFRMLETYTCELSDVGGTEPWFSARAVNDLDC